MTPTCTRTCEALYTRLWGESCGTFQLRAYPTDVLVARTRLPGYQPPLRPPGQALGWTAVLTLAVLKRPTTEGPAQPLSQEPGGVRRLSWVVVVDPARARDAVQAVLCEAVKVFELEKRQATARGAVLVVQGAEEPRENPFVRALVAAWGAA